MKLLGAEYYGNQVSEQDTTSRVFEGWWYRRYFAHWFRLAEPERQPQRSVPQQERFEAEPEPQLDRERLERDLSVRCSPKLVLFSSATH